MTKAPGEQTEDGGSSVGGAPERPAPVTGVPGHPGSPSPDPVAADLTLVDDIPGSIVRAGKGVASLVGKAIRSLWAD